MPEGGRRSGNIDVAREQPLVRTPRGTATVQSMSFFDPQVGGEVLIPQVQPDGRILQPRQAIDAYRQSGRHLGVFQTPEEATAYGQGLHEREATRVRALDELARRYRRR